MDPSTSPHCEMGPSAVPEWLGHLLAAPYFSSCPLHAALHKSERNFFCVSCSGSSLCSICAQREHAGPSHSLLQIRKSSYHDAVRIADVGKLLDLAGIQVYVINGAKIVFLRGRPQARPVKGAPYHCETCQRTLLDACRFCSIGCKLDALSHDCSLSIVPSGQPKRHSHGDGHVSLAMSDDESGESGHHHRMGHGLRDPKVASPLLHKTPPRLPMLLEERDDVSSGDSLELRRGDRFGMLKRRRLHEPEEVTSAFPPLEDAMQPGTPPLGSPFPAASWRTHKRKGVPHRSPLA